MSIPACQPLRRRPKADDTGPSMGQTNTPPSSSTSGTPSPGGRVRDRAAHGGRSAHQDNEARGAQPEHRDLATHADPHGSNSAKRISNEAKRPVGGSQRTVTFSTRDNGGPFSSSRTNSWISARGPSARARTRPSLRFATKPESPRPSARRWAKLR